MIIEKPKIGIYSITNIKNNKKYIGQSANIELRWITHLVDSINNMNHLLIDQAMHGLGNYNFKLEILEECTLEELNNKEKYYIEKYNTIYPNGYNIKEGGKYTRNTTHNLNNNIEINVEDLYKLTPPLSIRFDSENNKYIIYSTNKNKIEQKYIKDYKRKNSYLKYKKKFTK